MKLFRCTYCSGPLHFEDSFCASCHHRQGFVDGQLTVVALAEAGSGLYKIIHAKNRLPADVGGHHDRLFKLCSNHDFDACNWLVPADGQHSYCRACEHNRMVPDLADPEQLRNWRLVEVAKHRLVYTLLQLKLPLVSKLRDLNSGLSFDFLTDECSAGQVLTGHRNGLITININEADDNQREISRRVFNEPYRTLLGHFRHEIGHYYWERLIAGGPFLTACRGLFGDERSCYQAALNRHYQGGAKLNWKSDFISSYASVHPWEVWAETWAHYLHILDTLETANVCGIVVGNRDMKVAVKKDPYRQRNFKVLLDLWRPLTTVINTMNRMSGIPELYPFEISPKVVKKLNFIHRICYTARLEQAA